MYTEMRRTRRVKTVREARMARTVSVGGGNLTCERKHHFPLPRYAEKGEEVRGKRQF